MAFELIYVLDVTDDRLYQQYRDAIAPILAEHHGGFRYDLLVSQVLKSDAAHPVNRAFAIYFPDRATKDAFFSNPAYKAIRATYFPQSVGGITLVAEHERTTY